jgi:hypothetical protein
MMVVQDSSKPGQQGAGEFMATYRVPVIRDLLEANRLADVHQVQDVLLEA